MTSFSFSSIPGLFWWPYFEFLSRGSRLSLYSSLYSGLRAKIVRINDLCESLLVYRENHAIIPIIYNVPQLCVVRGLDKTRLFWTVQWIGIVG